MTVHLDHPIPPPSALPAVAATDGDRTNAAGSASATPTPAPWQHQRRKRRRWPTFVAGAVLGAAATAAVSAAADDDAAADVATDAIAALSSVAVEQRDLVTYTEYPATLEASPALDVAAGADGTITATVASGTVLAAGQVLAAIDDQPVYLLTGNVPAWRDLEAGIEPGADVRQLEEFLVAAGFDPDGRVVVDGEFNWWTVEAVRRWQEANGADVDGRVPLGSVVFVPGPVTVAEPAVVGDAAMVSSPLATVRLESDTAIATLAVVVDDLDLFPVGAAVEVVLADGSTAAGTVTEIATTVTTADGSSGTATGSGSSGGEPTVEVTIEIGGDSVPFEGAVTVRLPDDQALGVLAVPTRALVALAEGGQAVEVLDSGDASALTTSVATSHLVAVKTGVYADGWVEIESPDLAAGDQVVVPA